MATGCPNVMLLKESIFQLQEPRMFCIANFSSYTPGLSPNYNTWAPSIVIACHHPSNLTSNWSSQRHAFQILTSHYIAWVPKRFDPFYIPTLLQGRAALHGFLLSLPAGHWCSQGALGCTHSNRPLRLQALDFGKKLWTVGFRTGNRCVYIYSYKKHLAREDIRFTFIYIYATKYLEINICNVAASWICVAEMYASIRSTGKEAVSSTHWSCDLWMLCIAVLVATL